MCQPLFFLQPFPLAADSRPERNLPNSRPDSYRPVARLCVGAVSGHMCRFVRPRRYAPVAGNRLCGSFPPCCIS